MNKPRKRFGQNFLQDERIIADICAAIDPADTDQLVEIGPGRGALTKLLAQFPLTLIEIDRDLAAQLKQQFPNVPLVCADVLNVEFNKLGNNLRVIGNLPYNISTPLLFRLFEQISCIRDMHFMLQLEVVDRMASAPGSRSYGRLSVMTQIHCDVTKLMEVPPTAFYPAPKVRSAVARLTPLTEPKCSVPAVLEKVVTQAFSARRKTIRNGLKSLLSETELIDLGIDPGDRPENLSIDQFIACADRVADP